MRPLETSQRVPPRRFVKRFVKRLVSALQRLAIACHRLRHGRRDWIRVRGSSTLGVPLYVDWTVFLAIVLLTPLALIDRSISGYADGTSITTAIIARNEWVGMIGVADINPRDGEGQLWYWLAGSAERQGFAASCWRASGATCAFTDSWLANGRREWALSKCAVAAAALNLPGLIFRH